MLLCGLVMLVNKILIVSSCLGALPNTNYWQYQPAAYGYQHQGPAGYGRPPGVAPHHRSESAASSFSSGGSSSLPIRTVRTVAELNCRSFDDSCRWSNTNEDELDWQIASIAPETQRWIATLGVIPDTDAAVLSSSSQRLGWESGRLVSDPIACISHPIRFSAIVSVSRSIGTIEATLPSLHLCTRNVDSNLPLSNCQRVHIHHNGQPVIAMAPVPDDPTSPAQLILVGDNFISLDGGAIFVQDITVDGDSIECTGHGGGGGGFGGASSFSSTPRDPVIERPLPPPVSGRAQIIGARERVQAAGIDESLLAACLTLSCNPATSDCRWTPGERAWLTARNERVSNPLTGVHLPPFGEDGFLVAPFGRASNSIPGAFTLISQSLDITSKQPPSFLCFFEYLATEGMRLSICADRDNCFYRRTNLTLGSRAQVSVVGENLGDNQGDLGFVPVRLARDPAGSSSVC